MKIMSEVKEHCRLKRSSWHVAFSLFFFLILISCHEKDAPFKFFVAGHVYGSPGAYNKGVHPPFSVFLDSMGSIDSYNFGVYLGDIVFESSPESWNNIDSQIIKAFAKPVHFAVGNHDIVDRPLFEARYGKTFKKFDYKNSRFIFLDPNYDHWNISGYQYEFLLKALSNLDHTKNIFIFCHQVIWWRWDNKYSELKLNSHEGFKAFPNYWKDIHPVLDSLPIPVYIFSGDLGAASWAGNFM